MEQDDEYECRRFLVEGGDAEGGQHPRGGDLLGATQGRFHQIRSLRQRNIQIFKPPPIITTYSIATFFNLYALFKL